MKLATESFCFVGFWQACVFMRRSARPLTRTQCGKKGVSYTISNYSLLQREPLQDLQTSCFLQLCYYWFDSKENKLQWELRLFSQLVSFPFTDTLALPNTHTHIYTQIKAASTPAQECTHSQRTFFFWEREREHWLLIGGWRSAYLPWITSVELCSANKACFDR